MIILDTNVMSELWKLKPHPNVVNWIDKQTIETLFLSSITVAELRYGIAIMAKGKRRMIYHDRLEKEVLAVFYERILPFDLKASQEYAELMSSAKEQGKAISKEDGYIAAIAKTHGLIVATRDTSPFLAAELEVINPWEILI